MATVTKSASLTANPSGYNTSYTTCSFNTSYPATNAYADTASTTYAYATASSSSTYVSFTFGDFSSIPSDATISSVNCSVKYRVSNTSRISSVSVQLYTGNTAKGSATTTINTTATSYSLTCGSWSRTELDSLMLRFTHTRSGNSTAGTYIYGAVLTIAYTWNETAYTVTTTITEGTVTSTNPVTVAEGESTTVTFTKTNDSDVLKSMTVNGTDVTPTYVEAQAAATNVTITASTNTSGYNSTTVSSVVDGDSTSYYWDNSTQAVGDYILLTLSQSVYLTGVDTVATNSSTDYPQSNCVLQVSTDGSTWETVGTFADGEQTQSFTGINKTCQYVRLYITSAADYWWCINEITLTYNTEAVEAHYEYTINSVSDDEDIIIVFGSEGPVLRLKVSATVWKKSKKIYQKTSSGWSALTVEEFRTLAADKKFKQLEMPAIALGNVTSSTNAINITDDTIAADTYTLYYEDAEGNKLDNWDAIGTITKS